MEMGAQEEQKQEEKGEEETVVVVVKEEEEEGVKGLWQGDVTKVAAARVAVSRHWGLRCMAPRSVLTAWRR